MSEFFDSLNFAGGAGYGEASFSQVVATRSGSSSAIGAPGSRSNSASGVNTTPGTLAPGRIPGSAGGSGGSAAALAPPPQSQAIVFWKHASPSLGSQFAASLRNRGAGPATRGGKGQLGYTSPASAKHASALSPSPLANLDTARTRRYDDESPLGAERELANQARARSAKSAGKRKADGLGDEDGMDLDSPLKPGASRAQSLKAGSEASGSSSSAGGGGGGTAGATGASTTKRATHRARTMKRSRTSRISAAVPWADPNTSIDTSFDMSSDSLLANTTIGAAGTATGAGGTKAGASDPAHFIAYVNAHLFKGLDDTSQDPPRADVPSGMATATRSGGARGDGGSGRSTRAGTAPPEPVEDRQGEQRDGRQARGEREMRNRTGGVNNRKAGSTEEEAGSSSSGMQPRNSSWNRHHTDPSPKINRSPIRKLTTKPTPAAAPVSPAKSASPKRAASAAKAAPAVKAAPTEARAALRATTPASRSTTKSPSPQKAAAATNGSMARSASNASINTRVTSSRAAPQAGNASHKNRSPTPPASNAGPSSRPPVVKTLGSTARRTPSSASAPFRAPSTSGSSNVTHNSGLSTARTPLHTKRPSPGTAAPLRTVSTSPKRGSTPAKAIVIDDDDDDEEGAGCKRGAADDGMGDDSFDFGDDADFATISDMLADQGI